MSAFADDICAAYTSTRRAIIAYKAFSSFGRAATLSLGKPKCVAVPDAAGDQDGAVDALRAGFATSPWREVRIGKAAELVGFFPRPRVETSSLEQTS